MIAHALLPLPDADDARTREIRALQAAWAELDEAHRLLTAHGVPGGSLPERLRAALRVEFYVQDETAPDILDSLVGCALTRQQLCEDTGRDALTVHKALQRLRSRGFVWRERRGKVWVYRATALGARALRGGGR